MIKLNDVSKIYDKKTLKANVAISDVSLDIEERGLVSIFGPSGCGKTTLLNLITGMDRPTSGTVTIDGKEVDDDYRLNNIGLVFQDFVLCDDMTVEENITLVDKTITQKEIDETLGSLGILSLKERKAGRLSGGERQRVSIARAIVKKPRFIVCDEPTGNLDEKNRVLIMDILKSLSKHYLVILVSHDRELTEEYSDRIIYLVDGSVVRDVKKKEPETEAVAVKPERKIEYRPIYKKFFKAKTNYIAIFLTVIATVFTSICSALIVAKPDEMIHVSPNTYFASRVLSKDEFSSFGNEASVFWNDGERLYSNLSIHLSPNSDQRFGESFFASSTAEFLPASNITGMKNGSKTIGFGEVALSSGFADQILQNGKTSTNIPLRDFGIEKEDDLLGLSMGSYGKRIVGISDEPRYVVYLNDNEFFLENNYSNSSLRTAPTYMDYGNYMNVSKYNELYGGDFANDDQIFIISTIFAKDETGTIRDTIDISVPIGETFYSRQYRLEVSPALTGNVNVVLPDYLFYLIFPNSVFCSSNPEQFAKTIKTNHLPIQSHYDIEKENNTKTSGFAVLIFGSILFVILLMAVFFFNVDVSSYVAGNRNELMVLRSLGVNKKELIKTNFLSIMKSVLISSFVGIAGGTVLALYLMKFSEAMEYYMLVNPLTVILSYIVSLSLISLIVWAFLKRIFGGSAATFKRVSK